METKAYYDEYYSIDSETVRYVYQPLEELYMVLITNKQSNILQDIESLHLFAQITQSICRTIDEREILRNAFELLSAFDEPVALGYKENLTLSQIRTFIEMESHEERIQEIISRVIFPKPLHRVGAKIYDYRTKNSRPVRKGSGRQSNWRYSGRS